MGGTQQAVPIQVLIADKVELFRRGLRDALELAGLAVAKELPDLDGLDEAYEAINPDVALVGVGEDGGLDQRAEMSRLSRLLQREPDARVVALVPGASWVLPLIQAGVPGVLLRDAPASAVVSAARDVCAGDCALDPRLARALFQNLTGADGRASATAADASLDPVILALLSQREREVLRVLALGYRNKRIADELGVSVGTVKTHLRHIFRKLQVADRTSAVLVAMHVRMKDAA